MQFSTTLLVAVLAAVTVSSAPTAPQDFSSCPLQPLTADTLIKIAPASASCDKAQFDKSECTTGSQALPHILNSFSLAQISTVGEAAALLSTMAVESGDFQANINHFPGRPGQGTKAMLFPDFIEAYARSLPEFTATVARIEDFAAEENQNKNKTVNAIRRLVLPNKYTFNAAAWYLKLSSDLPGGCPKDTQMKLKSDGYKGFEYYIQKCIKAGEAGKPIDPVRIEKWCTAIEALKENATLMPSECAVGQK